MSAITLQAMTERGEQYICTWLYAESEEIESTYYQLRGQPSSNSFQAVYWRCVAVCFATSYRQQPKAKHLLFTNTQDIPSVDGLDVKAFLERLGVEVVRLPLTFATPPDYYHAWRNQFYVFDIVRELRRRLEPDDSAIVLDADCVWVSNAGPMQVALRRDGALAYVQPYPLEWRTNDLTRIDLQDVSRGLLGQDVAHPLLYCGGELIAFTGSEAPRLISEIESTWSQLMNLYGRGEPTFNEEGQTLSYIYYKLGYPIGNGNPFIRRIWTGSFGAHNTARVDDHGLVLWHLPSEKRFGMRRLFAEVMRQDSEFWSLPVEPELREYLGGHLGVPSNGPQKQVKDLLRRILDLVRYS